MYILGQELRNHYNDFIPKYYWPVDVNFSSSSVARCLTSAELVGAGLFPPQDVQIWNPDLLWQPIPIHYLPRNVDNLLTMKSNCTEYDNQFRQVHNSSKVLQYNQAYENLYEYLTIHTGMTVDNIETVESLHNTLEIYQMNNLSLPYWINDTLMAQMKIIAAQNLAIYSETNYMKRMKGGYFIKTVLDLMKSSLNSKKVPSINMYAAHDLTLVHVMRALDLIDTLKPELGATLIFELYDDEQIKVYYWENWKGKIEEQLLPHCRTICRVEQFQEGYQEFIPENWYEECQVKI
ncbi:hypothetical protein ABEB36_011205 [Hypothenemus hampei]